MLCTSVFGRRSSTFMTPTCCLTSPKLALIPSPAASSPSSSKSNLFFFRIVVQCEWTESWIHLQVRCHPKTGSKHKVMIDINNNNPNNLDLLNFSILLNNNLKEFMDAHLKNVFIRYRDLSRDYSNSRYEVSLLDPYSS